MAVSISVTLELVMGHRIPLNRCNNLHGHNYMLTFWTEGNPSLTDGTVRDYGELKQCIRETLDRFDHTMVLFQGDPVVNAFGQQPLQDCRLLTISNWPSAEVLCSLFFNLFIDAGLRPSRVDLKETANTSAMATRVDRSIKMVGYRNV